MIKVLFIALRWPIAVLLLGLCALTTASADSGDLFEVTAEEVNLRAGPSDETTVLTTVLRGDKMIELRREGSWIGVRVLNTGDEGWIYSELIGLISQSRLNQEPTQTSFAELSPEFEKLIGGMTEHLGYSIIDSVAITDGTNLRLKPSRNWLLRTSSEAHLMAATAFYQMWKHHNKDQPVSLVLMDDRDNAYLTIADQDSGPVWTFAALQ